MCKPAGKATNCIRDRMHLDLLVVFLFCPQPGFVQHRDQQETNIFHSFFRHQTTFKHMDNESSADTYPAVDIC